MNKKYLAAAVVMGMFGSAGAFAATADGTVGATSTGTVDVNVRIPELIRITGLVTIDLGDFDGENDASGSSDACVRTNAASGTYSLDINTDNGLNLRNGTDDIPYSLAFGANTVAAVPFSVGGQTPDAATLGGACGASAANKIQVDVTAADMAAVPGGTGADLVYTDTITITVSPE